MTSSDYTSHLRALAIAYQELRDWGAWPLSAGVPDFHNGPSLWLTGSTPREGVELLPDLVHVVARATGRRCDGDNSFRHSLNLLLSQIVLSVRPRAGGDPGQPFGDASQCLEDLLAKCGGVAATWAVMAPVASSRNLTDPLPESLLELVMDDIAAVVCDDHYDHRDDCRVEKLCHALGGTPRVGLASLEAGRSRGMSVECDRTGCPRLKGVAAFRSFVTRRQEVVVWRCSSVSVTL